MIYNDIKHIIGHFNFAGEYTQAEEMTSGNINLTYRLIYKQPDGSVKKYVLQKINTVAFNNPVELMKNVQLVLDHVAAAMARHKIDCERHVLEFIPTKEGSLLYKDQHGGYWRADVFIDNATAYDSIDDPEHFREAGRAFGEFQRYLSDFPADKLVETIPNFHNTKRRFYTFVASVAADKAGRG